MGDKFVSHIVQIQTEVRDPVAVGAACLRLKLPAPVHGNHILFSGAVTGLGVQLHVTTHPDQPETEPGAAAAACAPVLPDDLVPTAVPA